MKGLIAGIAVFVAHSFHLFRIPYAPTQCFWSTP